MQYGTDLDLLAFDKFLELPGIWTSRTARETRDELLQLRQYAVRAYDAGKIELALMTARVMKSEARNIGMRVTADPHMRTWREAQLRGKRAQKASTSKRTSETAKKLNRPAYQTVVQGLYKQYGKAPVYLVAKELGVSQPTLREWKKKNVISES